MLEQRVSRVISAKGGAHCGDGHMGLAIIPDEGDDFLAKIGIKNGLNIAAMERMHTLVVEAEAIDGIDGVKLDAAGINEIRKSTDHALALELPLVAGTGRKTEERRPPVSINDNAKFEAQARRMPAMVLTLHVECPFEPRERSIRAAQGSGQCNCSSKRERRTAGLQAFQMRVG